MRGLLKAALLLAPALASTLIVPGAEIQEFDGSVDRPVAGIFYLLIQDKPN
jgi:hypothetical protein